VKYPEDLNQQVIDWIQREMDLYRGLVGLASLEKKAITAEYFEGLAKIADDKKRHILKIEELEVQFSPLRKKWKDWSGRDTRSVRHWVDLLTGLARELASQQRENQELLENLLGETNTRINKLKSSGHASNRYKSQRKYQPRFVDIKG